MVDPDDVITRCYLRSYSASLTCLAGDASDMTELFTTAQRHGEDRLTWLVSLPVANTNANAGRLDAADEVFAVVRRMLAVRGLPLGHHTAPVIPGLAAFVAMLRGDLERARCVLDTPGQPDAMLIIANNAWAAMVGYVTADLALLDRLASWQATAEEALKAEVRATSEPSPLSGPALNVHWARAVIERRFVDALPLLRIAHAGTPTSPALRSYVLVPLVTRLLDAGEVGEAANLVEVLAADVDRLDDAPLLV